MLARKTIRGLKPYEPGKPISELARELRIRESNIIKLASNENPIGPSPKAMKAVAGAIKEINRYPDGGCFYLKKKLASKLRLKTSNILFGNGSDEIIDIIAKTFLEESQEAIISKPSFLEYKIIVKTRGAGLKIIPLDESCSGFNYNIDKIVAAISKKTKLIFLGNPDNPTGAYFKKKELNYFLRKCPKDIIVVFDEAYRELIDIRDYSNPASYINKKNIIVLRTFSKAYGLAGLRIGYCIASSRIISFMERTRQPFNVNLLAQVAAEAALSDKPHLLRSRRLIRQGMRFLAKNLKSLGCDVIETPANFILFSCSIGKCKSRTARNQSGKKLHGGCLVSYKGIKGAAIFKKLLPYGVIVRSMKVYGLDKWARVNAGTMQENRRFISTLKEIIGAKS
ncbi:MAG: histidinol-phosphate transaminase [Candidatus Omnitrophica bacterium]|nr:histidinol-phosphate transaminase [Candidatus Omnitrophota bacterium]